MDKKSKKKFYINEQYKRVQVFCACDRKFNFHGGDRCVSTGKYFVVQCPKCNYYYWIRQSK